MPDDRPDIPTSNDPYSRIEELEQQVRELSGLVSRMIDQQVHPADNESPEQLQTNPDQLELHDEDHDPGLSDLVHSLGHRIGQALGGEEGESLESRIGGIWLTRIAAVLMMTVVALGFALTIRDAGLGAWQKIGAGYGVAVAGIAYGLFSRARQDVLAQTALGCGLAVFYFTTYATGFITDMQLIPDPRVGVAVLAVALLLVMAAIHVRRSQGAAGITLFLIFYTVVLSMRGSPLLSEVMYAFGTCAVLAIAALIFHLQHRWLTFTWGALIATHLTYLFFFKAKPPDLGLTDEQYFWLSNGTLAFIYILFSTACVTDARRTGEYRRTVGPMCGVNSFLFFTLTWFAIRDVYPEYEWAFRLGFAALLVAFAAYAHLSGPRLNYLFQIFVAKALILFTLALQAYLSHEWLLVAMALECLGLGLSYQRSGLVVFKLMGLILLSITFAGAIVSVRIPGEVAVFNWRVPANWFVCVGAPFVFTLVAAFYEHFVRRVPPEKRVVKGQWFLADGVFDIRSTTVAMVHAAAAAIILMVVTIIELGESPHLPYILAGESIALVAWGLVLRTPQIDVAGVLLLAASHMTYHTFLLIDHQGFGTYDYFVHLTVGIALLTYLGGFLWERYLSRIEGGTDLEHDLLAGIPYLAATLMLVTLVTRQLEPHFAALVLNLIAVGLMLVSAIAKLTGIRASGVLALALGTALFYREMYNFSDPLALKTHFFATLIGLLITFTATERLVLAWGRGQNEVHDSTPDFVRSLLVIVASLLGVLALWEWSPPHRLSLYLLGLSLGAMVIGVIFGESRYRWAAIVIYFIALLRAYGYDLPSLSPPYRFVSFVGLCIPLLVISWGYSRYRARTLRELHTGQQPDDSHGQKA